MKFPALKLVHSIVLLSALLTTGILIVSTLYLSSLGKQWQAAKSSVDVLFVIDRLAMVAHHHAVERGLTAGYLGSKGQRFKAELLAQRQKSDQSIERLSAIAEADLDTLSLADVDSLKRAVINLAKEKAAIRARVDSLQASSAFTYYSELNERALNAIASTALYINDSKLKNGLDGILAGLWVQERTGQIRGMVNGVFASGQVNPEKYYTVRGFIQDKLRAIGSFERYAEPRYLSRFTGLKTTPQWQTMADVYHRFQSGSDRGTIQDPTDGQWFTVATQVIADSKAISNDMALAMHHRADQIVARQGSILIYQLLAAALIILITVLANYVIIASIKRRVNAVHTTLQTIGEQSDLSLRLNTDTRDELGSIGDAINCHLDQVGKVFSDFNITSNGSVSKLQRMASSIDSATANAARQNDISSHISTSMQDILGRTNAVSQDMTKARESMQGAAVSVRTSHEECLGMRQIFSQLSSGFCANLNTIEELANHSQEIRSILDTISGIAEQTNLLALNAAIEAARAGEQGRGFAVVADEVRSLARKTQESTDSIRDMIDRLGASSQSALNAMKSSQTSVQQTETRVAASVAAVDAVSSEIKNLQEIIQSVADGAATQVEMINDVENTVVDMNRLAQDTLEQTQAVSLETGELSQHMLQLDKAISSFNIG